MLPRSSSAAASPSGRISRSAVFTSSPGSTWTRFKASIPAFIFSTSRMSLTRRINLSEFDTARAAGDRLQVADRPAQLKRGPLDLARIVEHLSRALADQLL